MPSISGDVATLLGEDHTPSNPVALWVEASEPIVVDGSLVRVGGRIRAKVGSDGTFVIADLPATVSGTTPLYRLTIDSTSLRLTGQMHGQATGWFPLTVDRDLTWITANYVAVTVVTTQTVANVAAAAALGATNDTATASYVANKTSATAVALRAGFIPVITPEKYGAVGNGIADDTSAVRAAFEEATALRVVGLGGNIWHPGATVHLRGTYKLTSLSSRLVASCNITSDGATLVAPNAYAGTVLFVGHETDGYVLHSADMALPNVIKVGATTLPAGGVGVQLQNLHHSRVRCARVTHHETGLWFTALGAGNVYNEYFPGWVDLCKISWKLSIQTGGWVNQNTIIAGGITQSPNAYGGAATRRSGWRHILLDGGTGDTVHANTFVGVSLEGDYSEDFIEFKNAAENVFTGNTRFEQGTPGVTATVSAQFNVFTIPDASGLVAGDAVLFTATAAPGGVTLEKVYWVYAVTGNDFSITTTPGGGGVILDVTSAGTNVKMYRPPRIHFDNSSGNTRDNVIYDYNNWPGRELSIKRTGAAAPTRKAAIVG